MSLPISHRLLNIAAVAIMVAVIDWSLKVWATIDLAPEDIVLNTDRQWHAIPVCIVIGAALLAVARTPLLAFGGGLVMGGALGNLGEQAMFGHVTDFIPLGFPAEGSTWSPADFVLIAGLLILWVGAVRARRQAPMPGNQGKIAVPMTTTTTPTQTATNAASTIPGAITENPQT